MEKTETTVKNLLNILDEIAPFSLAESWDNCGLQAGDRSWGVERVVTALDVTMAAMEYAVDVGAGALVTHHPLMLGAPKSMDFSVMPGRAVAVSARKKIAVISAHTNLDKASGGLNDYFAKRLGLHPLESLVDDAGSIAPDKPGKENRHGDTASTPGAIPEGIGRVGALDKPMKLKPYAQVVKETFGAGAVRIVGDLNLDIQRVAVCTGSGGSLLKEFFRSGADLYITGDIKYHEARDVELAGRGLIDLGHFASEQIAVTLLEKKIKELAVEKGMSLDVLAYRHERDPFFVAVKVEKTKIA